MPRWYLWLSWAKQKYSCFLRIDLIYSWRRLEGRISSRMWLSTTRRIATAVVGVDFAAFRGSVRYCSKVVNKSENEATTTVTPFSSFFTLSFDIDCLRKSQIELELERAQNIRGLGLIRIWISGWGFPKFGFELVRLLKFATKPCDIWGLWNKLGPGLRSAGPAMSLGLRARA